MSGAGASVRTAAQLDPTTMLQSTDFALLKKDDSGAFLKWEDAVESIRDLYVTDGLVDAIGQRRIARIVKLPAGTRLFKATQRKVVGLVGPLSPWWSTVEPFQESGLGALDVVEHADANLVTFRDMVRFISAISVDFNKLDFYVEIVLRTELYAFWGQFAPQKGLDKAPQAGATVTAQTVAGAPAANYVDHGDGRRSYLPDWLGGFGAWQLYIPNFDMCMINPSEIKSLSSTDNKTLARYLRAARRAGAKGVLAPTSK